MMSQIIHNMNDINADFLQLLDKTMEALIKHIQAEIERAFINVEEIIEDEYHTTLLQNVAMNALNELKSIIGKRLLNLQERVNIYITQNLKNEEIRNV